MLSSFLLLSALAPIIGCGYSGTTDDPKSGDWDGDGFTGEEGDCANTDAAFYPGAPDSVGDDVDQNCDLADGVDADGDGHATIESGGDDCDDTSREVQPDAYDTWYDGVDSDCLGNDDYDRDEDGDQSSEYGGTDCNDNDPGIPSPEVWDEVDNDCNGCVDEVGVEFTYEDDGDGGSIMVITLARADPRGSWLGFAETGLGGAGYYGESCLSGSGDCHALEAYGGTYAVVDDPEDVRLAMTTYFDAARLQGSAAVIWDTKGRCTAVGAGPDYYASAGCCIQNGW